MVNWVILFLQKDLGGNLDWILDEEAIAKDAQFDGYYGIQTNEKGLKITKDPEI